MFRKKEKKASRKEVGPPVQDRRKQVSRQRTGEGWFPHIMFRVFMTKTLDSIQSSINLSNMKRYVHFEQLDNSNALVQINCIPEPGDPDRVVNEAKTIERTLYDSLTFRNEQKANSYEGKHHIIDIFDYFYDIKKHCLLIGLMSMAKKILKSHFPDIQIDAGKSLIRMFTPPHGEITLDEIKRYAESLNMHNAKKNFKLTPFNHQYDLAYKALNYRRVSLLACTSSGKSLAMMIIARYLMEKENKKVLIVVPSSNLVKQLFNDFHVEYGWADAGDYCTQIYGTSDDKLSKKELEKLQKMNIGEEMTLRQITISTWQSLQTKDASFFRVFGAVLVDEAHSTRGEKLRMILQCCYNANNFKVGVSGTLPDNGLDAAYIEGSIGRKIDVIHLHELIQMGILTPVEVNAIYVPYPHQYRPMMCDSARCKYEDEFALVTGNSSRRDIMDMLMKAGQITTDQNTVILFKGIENLMLMHDFLKETHPEFTYYIIKGDISPDEREKIREFMDEGVGRVIIATYGCMQQGVNIPRLHNLVFAEPSKSPYIVIQSIGRVVRKYPGKKLARIFDFVDDASYMTKARGIYQSHIKANRMMSHFYTRCNYYNAEHIPINPIKMEGLYEAKITPEDIEKRKQKVAANAAKKANAKAKKKSPYKKKFFFV